MVNDLHDLLGRINANRAKPDRLTRDALVRILLERGMREAEEQLRG